MALGCYFKTKTRLAALRGDGGGDEFSWSTWLWAVCNCKKDLQKYVRVVTTLKQALEYGKRSFSFIQFVTTLGDHRF